MPFNRTSSSLKRKRPCTEAVGNMAMVSRKRTRAAMPVLELFRTSEYTGKALTSLRQLPDEIMGRHLELDDPMDTSLVIRDLSEFAADVNFDTNACLSKLKFVLNKMTNFEARRPQEEPGTEDRQTAFCRYFVENGGVDVLVQILMYSCLLPPQPMLKYSRETEHQLRCKSVVLEILARIITTETGEKLGKKLTEHAEIVNYVFSLLVYDKTCLMACQFLEDMLQARKSVLSLNTVGKYDLKTLISVLDDRKLANFCRVLAITISDLDIYENKSSLFAQNKQKRSKGFVNIRDQNQELLLSIPDLLPRLVNIATAKNYKPRYPAMQSELDCWMEWIENALADDAFDNPSCDDFEDFVGGISIPSSEDGPMVKQSGLEISTDLILRVEVVYVLGLFLVGKHRKKVQRKLAELQLVPGLSELFEQFIWKCNGRRNATRHRPRGHNSSCECSPEVALKIQFLRLVHSFCDHSDYKHLLLSKSELSELKRINAKAGPLTVDKLENINKQLMCRGSRGLLTKIVDVMKEEPQASTFRFWLARAVESYLRGSTSYCDQVFLLRRGLLQHIASNIVEHDIRPKEILQSSFDLLGELIKFNIDAFKAFDKVLTTKTKFERFITIVDKYLVDSNMFIRSLVLSYEHFCNVQPEFKGREYSRKENCLLKHVSDFDTQMGYLTKLINLISVQNLTQENVSCLNTTLVFLMFANQKSAMPKYLRGLSSDRYSTNSCTSGSSLLKNFRDLLIFWQDHYLHKDKDCSALEKSSRISFDYWKQTVITLVSEDRNCDASILHYLDPGDSASRNS